MSSAFRFVHAADLHLDTPFRSRHDAIRRRLNEATREAFTRLVDLCLQERAHALLLAGDVFDNERLSFATEAFLVSEMERLTGGGVTVVMATGNHDPGQSGERAQRLAWPTERFHLLRTRDPLEIVIPDEDGEPVGRVIGAGHQTKSESANLAATYPEPAGPEPAVGLLHAQVSDASGASEHQPYAPCSRKDLGSKGYRYWALGHVHQRQRVLDRPAAWYPGNLQGRHFGECGSKGALLVSIPASGGLTVKFRPLAPVRWERLALDQLAAAANLAELQALARAAFEKLLAGSDVLPGQEWMLRCVLSGETPLATALRTPDDREELAEQIRAELGVLGVEVEDAGVTPPLDLVEHRGQPHLLGLTLEVLDELARDDALLARVIPQHLAACDEAEPDARAAYARALLGGLDRAAAEALLREVSP